MSGAGPLEEGKEGPYPDFLLRERRNTLASEQKEKKQMPSRKMPRGVASRGRDWLFYST